MYAEHFLKSLIRNIGMSGWLFQITSCIPEHFRNQFEYVTHFYLSSGPYVQDRYVGVLKYTFDNVTYYFIDNQEFYSGFTPYTSDTKFEIEKFTFLIRQYCLCFRLSILSRI